MSISIRDNLVASASKTEHGSTFMQKMGGFPETGFLPVALRWISASRRSFLYEFNPTSIVCVIDGRRFTFNLPWRSWLITTPLNSQVGLRVRLFFQPEPISSSLSDLFHAPWPHVAPGTGSYILTDDTVPNKASDIARHLDTRLYNFWGDNSPIAHSPFTDFDDTDHIKHARQWSKLTPTDVLELNYEWWGNVDDLIAEIQAEEAHDEPSTTTAWLAQWL